MTIAIRYDVQQVNSPIIDCDSGAPAPFKGGKQ